MEVKSVEKFVRISPKKARLVADLVRGQKAQDSLVILRHTQKKSAKIILKAVKSACANAENNHRLSMDDLIIKQISVDNGPSLKRFQPVSKGMAHHILKRTSHITVVVADKQKDKPKSKKIKAVSKKTSREVTKDSTKLEIIEKISSRTKPEKVKSKTGIKEKK